MMKLILYITITLVILGGCKEDKATSIQTESTKVVTLPPFPIAELKNLFENGSAIDYIFHNLPFSISQNTPDGVKGNIVMIDQHSPINFDYSCPALGREFFSVGGEIVWEAEVHFDQTSGCGAYVFYKNNKAVYISGISDSGKEFYTSLINQSFQQKK